MFRKTIIGEFFTTISKKQALDSLYLMTFGLNKLKNGKNIKEAENKLKYYLKAHNSKVISFYNARSSLYHALKLIGIEKEDEVIVNAYNCVSVSNAVIQSGAKIIYSDINKKDLSFNIKKLEENINKNTKVIIVQHTFGKTANIEKIIKLAHDKGIVVIEDCAHNLGTHTKGRHTGTYGDFAIFSTGRDKVISSVTGGFLLINTPYYQKRVQEIKKKLKNPPSKLILQNLSYNIIGYLAYKTYDFLKLGRVIIHISRKLKLITEILSLSEKSCNFNEFNYKLVNSLAYLASKQIDLLHDIKREKRAKSQYYIKKLDKQYEDILDESRGEKMNYFRYPVLLRSSSKKEELVKYMKKNGIILGTSWSGINIAPIGTNLEKSQYKLGSCKTAESISKRLVTLPNNQNLKKKDLDRIINLLNKFKS